MTVRTETNVNTPPRKPARARGASALMVGAGVFMSRIAGLVRTRVFAHFLGNSDAANAFQAAIRIPNILQNLLGEGVLSASFIPVYARLRAEGQTHLAARVAGIVASLLALVVSIVVLIGVLVTPLMVDVIAPGFHDEKRQLTIQLVQIMFPGIGLFVFSAWCLGILNSHRQFFISYVAPVFWNLAMIGTLIVFGGREPLNPLAATLAWGSVVGALLQFGVQLPFIFLVKTSDGKSIGHGIVPGLDTSLEPVRQIFKNLGPVVVSRGVVQISAFVDSCIASLLGSAVSGLGYAQILYTLPISLFGMSIAAAELPEMSSVLGTSEEIHAKLRMRLVNGKRTIAFYVIPCVCGFLILGKYCVAGLFQTGIFGPQDTLYVWYILMGSTVGLLAATWGRLYSSVFYALRDTRTPLRFAIVRVVLTGVLGVLFAFPLRPAINGSLRMLHFQIPQMPDAELSLGAVGLTLSAGIAGWIEFLLLRRALQQRIGSTALPNHYPSKIWFAALCASAAGWGAGELIHFRLHWLNLAVVLIAFGIDYAAITLLLRIPEAQAFLRRFR